MRLSAVGWTTPNRHDASVLNNKDPGTPPPSPGSSHPSEGGRFSTHPLAESGVGTGSFAADTGGWCALRAWRGRAAAGVRMQLRPQGKPSKSKSHR